MCNTDLEKHSPGCPLLVGKCDTLPSGGGWRELFPQQSCVRTVFPYVCLILLTDYETDNLEYPLLTWLRSSRALTRNGKFCCKIHIYIYLAYTKAMNLLTM